MDQTGLDVADVVEDVGTVHGGRRKGARGLLLGEGRRGLLRERGACCDRRKATDTWTPVSNGGNETRVEKGR